MAKELKSLEEIGHLYNGTMGRFWKRFMQNQIHMGYWDSSNSEASLAEACNKFTEVMIELSRIGAGERFIDIGCGYGVPAIKLVEAMGCEVDGVTVSESQFRDGNKLVLEAGLEKLVRIHLTDALNMPFDDNTFDGGWFFESIFHMGQLNALKEACRILKPGAPILIADITLKEPLEEGMGVIRTRTFGVNYQLIPEEYPEVMRQTGFEYESCMDVSVNILEPTLQKLHGIVREQKNEVAKIGGPEFQIMLEAIMPRVIEGMLKTCSYSLIKGKKL